MMELFPKQNDTIGNKENSPTGDRTPQRLAQSNLPLTGHDGIISWTK
jgi:hypothetical protein